MSETAGVVRQRLIQRLAGPAEVSAQKQELPREETAPENTPVSGPPANMRFQPGQSGNPGGRPKSALISKAVRKKLADIEEGQRLTCAERIALALVRRAIRGDVQAAKEIRVVTEGNLPHQVNIPPRFQDDPEEARRLLFAKPVGPSSTQ